MKLKRVLFPAVVLLTTVANANAVNLKLDFNSLPSAQGWTFWTNDSSLGNAAESQVYSTCTADGLPALCMDSTQLPYDSLDGSAYRYTRTDLDLTNPFTVFMRARILDEVIQGNPSQRNAFGLYMSAATGVGGEAVAGFGANPSRVQTFANNEAEVLVPFDTKQWHDYHFVVQPNGAFDLFVDSATSPIISGPQYQSSLPGELSFGDGSSYNAVHAEITAFNVTQISEPDTVLLFSTGVFYMTGKKRWRNVRCR